MGRSVLECERGAPPAGLLLFRLLLPDTRLRASSHLRWTTLSPHPLQAFKSSTLSRDSKYGPVEQLCTLHLPSKNSTMTNYPFPTAHTTTVQNPRLRLLNKLKNNEYPLMTFMALPSVRMAQIVALTGLDGIIVDCEHGHIGDDSMHNSVSAIAALGVSPIIRIRGPAPDIIKRALDTGAQ